MNSTGLETQPELVKPVDTKVAVSISALLPLLEDWRTRNKPKGAEYHSRVWYRGHSDESWSLLPKLYRDDANSALAHIYSIGPQARLDLEREMLEEFRNSATPFIDARDQIQIYFAAQHYGLPTRLLDWTTNPLVATYFAVLGHQDEKNGEILVMDASQVVQEPSDYNKKQDEEEKVGQFVLSVRHPHAVGAINESFWRKYPDKRVIIPIRPDGALGRISQQSSRFTLHRHQASSVKNPTLERILIPKDSKGKILKELNRLNVNHHSIYYDLDHLAKGIAEARGWNK